MLAPFAALALVLLLPTSRADAQSLAVGLARHRSSHELVHGGIGPDVALSIPVLAGAQVTVGYAWMRHEFHARQTLCFGLVPPGAFCPNERTSNAASLGLARVALEIPAAQWSSGAVTVGPEFLVGYVRASVRGEETSRSFDDEAPRVGVGLSLAARHRPAGWSRFTLFLSAGAATTWNPVATQMIDGHAPLDEGDGAYRLSLGTSVDLGRRRGKT